MSLYINWLKGPIEGNLKTDAPLICLENLPALRVLIFLIKEVLKLCLQYERIRDVVSVDEIQV